MRRSHPAVIAIGFGAVIAAGLPALTWAGYASFGGARPGVAMPLGLGLIAAGAAYQRLESDLAALRGDDVRAAYPSVGARLLTGAPGLALIAALGYVIWAFARNPR